jgi:hypothetical protein
MTRASEKAKAKLAEVLNDPGRTDSSGKDALETMHLPCVIPREVVANDSGLSLGMTNKIITGRHPSVGGSEITNRVDRRLSTSSGSSEPKPLRRMSWFSTPAY